jgi:uncharacterized repeat protein (TIGR03803 family)
VSWLNCAFFHAQSKSNSIFKSTCDEARLMILRNAMVSGLMFVPQDSSGHSFHNIRRGLLLLLLCAAGWMPSAVQAGTTLSNLFSFSNTTAANTGLILATDGNLYGIASGLLYEVLGDGSVTVFQTSPSAFNSTALVQRQYDGSFFGCRSGVQYGDVYRVASNAPASAVATFSGGNGSTPLAPMVEGSDGNFYGTAWQGGTNGGWGTVFCVTFNGRITTLHSFANGNEGAYPQAPLVEGADGLFYGTTTQGGTNNGGTIFKITRSGVLTTLYSFTGGYDGYFPRAGLVRGSDGNFYGTTTYGGSNDPQNGGDGTVFRIGPGGNFTSLASFSVNTGYGSVSALIQAQDGNFYGTTPNGARGFGTVYRVTPGGALASVYWFGESTQAGLSLTNGASPTAPLVQTPDGFFYGTTSQGGVSNYGTIFRLSIPPPPVLSLLNTGAGQLALSWNSTIGQIYQLQYKDGFSQTYWSNFTGTITATSTTTMVPDSIAPGPGRFYRVILLQ